MKSIIYLHGFNSSPASEKARLTQAFFNQQLPQFSVSVPALPPEPLMAISKIEQLIEDLGRASIAGFIGSSLGGYYSLYWQHRLGLPAVLINPALRPYELLRQYLGENTNLYTGERYVVEERHMADLLSLKVAIAPNPKQLFLLVQTLDEVLDYQQAVTSLKGAKMWIQAGGSHAFDNFAAVLPAMGAFFADRFFFSQPFG